MIASSLSRRNFVQLAAFSIGAISIGFSSTSQLSAGMSVALLHDPNDPTVAAPCVNWAVRELATALEQHGFKVRQLNSFAQLTPRDFCIVAAGHNSAIAAPILRKAAVTLPNKPECLALVPAIHGSLPLLLAAATDGRGLMYALLELTDRVRHAEDATRALSIDKPIVEAPHNEFRGICRPFVSDVEDQPWFSDREMWPAYFAMLATQRFNRFHLALGLGYDFLQHVTDAYLLFAYPFLLSVPGYDVRAMNLPDAERDRNLEMLQYISKQAVARH